MIIVIDGIDGSGKRIQSKRLINYFKKEGKSILFKRVPSRHVKGNSLANGIIFLKDLIRVRNLIFSIRKNRKKTNIIIERYILSVAYTPFPKLIYRLIRSFFLSPDIYIILDVSPKTAFSRIKKRKKLQTHETITTLKQIRNNYLLLSKYEAKKSKLYIIDAEKSKNEVEKCIRSILE